LDSPIGTPAAPTPLGIGNDVERLRLESLCAAVDASEGDVAEAEAGRGWSELRSPAVEAGGEGVGAESRLVDEWSSWEKREGGMGGEAGEDRADMAAKVVMGGEVGGACGLAAGLSKAWSQLTVEVRNKNKRADGRSMLNPNRLS